MSMVAIMGNLTAAAGASSEGGAKYKQHTVAYRTAICVSVQREPLQEGYGSYT